MYFCCCCFSCNGLCALIGRNSTSKNILLSSSSSSSSSSLLLVVLLFLLCECFRGYKPELIRLPSPLYCDLEIRSRPTIKVVFNPQSTIHQLTNQSFIQPINQPINSEKHREFWGVLLFLISVCKRRYIKISIGIKINIFVKSWKTEKGHENNISCTHCAQIRGLGHEVKDMSRSLKMQVQENM